MKFDRGILFAAMGFLCFTMMDFILKHLSEDLDFIQIVLSINLINLIVIAFLALRKGRDQLKTRKPGMHAAKGAINLMTAGLALYTLKELPISIAYCLFFSAPIISGVASYYFLGEKLTWGKTLALLLGFAGILTVLRPGYFDLTWAHLTGLLTAFAASCGNLIVRKNMGTETNFAFTFYGSLIVLICLIPLYTLDFKPIPLELIPYILIGGLLFTSAGNLIVLALRNTQVSNVGTLQYSQLVWSTLFGFILTGYLPDIPSFLGMGIIIFSGLFVAGGKFFRLKWL